jgi:hypothetical protein
MQMLCLVCGRYRTGELQEFDPNKSKRKTRQLLLLNDVLLLTERDSDGFYNLKVPTTFDTHTIRHDETTHL